MALLTKRPITETVMPLYTLSANKTMLIVGLGNIGAEYDNTRHNIGFACINTFADENEFEPWVNKKDLKSFITQKTLGETRVILAKPTTFMNLSGEAVQAIAAFYKIGIDNILIVADELDIPFGQIRMRTGGSAAGHNGVKSLIQHLGEDFGRIRVGIGPKLHEQQDSADFVLAKFSKEEQAKISDLTRETSAILTETIYGGQLHSETRSF
jgi:peptidyl-tRNA hydrolase, PTH1 family